MASPRVTLRAYGQFANNQDECTFYYEDENEWVQLGTPHKMIYKLDHFMGCRIGLFMFSTKAAGGWADFSNFEYKVK
ncbi:hypothetical protein D1872_302070 [compost metagenome]